MATVNEAITVLIDAIHDHARFAVGGEIHSLIDAAKAEERARILETHIGKVDGGYVIPARELDPKEVA